MLTAFVGSVQPGSPLRELLDSFGPTTATILEEELVSGIALGRNPNQIARLIRGRLNVGLGRARTIARTEVLRSYRSSTLAAYRRNPELVKQWVWHASLGPRCCAACWAMHGTEHQLGDEPSMHPACRCSLIPKTATWKTLGFDVPGELETSARVSRGTDLFAALPPADQLAVLGPRKFALYSGGAVELRDFVRVRRSRRWGTTRSVGSAEDALERAQRRPGADLSVRSWEVVEARKIIRHDLRRIIGHETNVMRVRWDVDAKQYRKHRDTIDVYRDLTKYLRNWQYWRKQDPSESRSDVGERWQVVQFVQRREDPEPWPLLTVLGIKDGDLYLATSHRRLPRWEARFFARSDIQKRGEE